MTISRYAKRTPVYVWFETVHESEKFENIIFGLQSWTKAEISLAPSEAELEEASEQLARTTLRPKFLFDRAAQAKVRGERERAKRLFRSALERDPEYHPDQLESRLRSRIKDNDTLNDIRREVLEDWEQENRSRNADAH